MKMYVSGKISLITTVAALVTWIQRTEGLHHSYPFLFWMNQVLFIIVIIGAICFAMIYWDKNYPIPKKRILLSIVIICLIYVMAWLDLKYSWMLILLLGTLETYSINQY